MQSSNSVARSDVEHLYDLLLRRPSRDGNIDYWLSGWKKVLRLVPYREIERHASARSGNRASDHPLRAFADPFFVLGG